MVSTGFLQMAHRTYRPAMMPWVDRDNSGTEVTEDEEAEQPRYLISEGEELSGPEDEFEYGDGHGHSDSAYEPGHPYDDDNDEEEGGDYEEDGDYLDSVADDDAMIRHYRRAVSRALEENGGEPPALVGPFLRLFDFLDQIRSTGRMNAIGPFIADEDFDESYEALLRLSERIGEVKQRGMSGEAVGRMREERWGTVRKAKAGLDGSGSCPVCLEAYGKGERLMVLGCSHGFHWACAERWLLVRATCPICRLEASPPPPPP